MEQILLPSIGSHGLHRTLLAARLTSLRSNSSFTQISVNASIISDSGGTCVCPTSDLCVNDAVYLQCVAEVNRDLITTTAAVAALASFLMGLLANLPVGMAPGLGLNAYVGTSHKF